MCGCVWEQAFVLGLDKVWEKKIRFSKRVFIFIPYLELWILRGGGWSSIGTQGRWILNTPAGYWTDRLLQTSSAESAFGQQHFTFTIRRRRWTRGFQPAAAVGIGSALTRCSERRHFVVQLGWGEVDIRWQRSDIRWQRSDPVERWVSIVCFCKEPESNWNTLFVVYSSLFSTFWVIIVYHEYCDHNRALP